MIALHLPHYVRTRLNFHERVAECTKQTDNGGKCQAATVDFLTYFQLRLEEQQDSLHQASFSRVCKTTRGTDKHHSCAMNTPVAASRIPDCVQGRNHCCLTGVIFSSPPPSPVHHHFCYLTNLFFHKLLSTGRTPSPKENLWGLLKQNQCRIYKCGDWSPLFPFSV